MMMGGMLWGSLLLVILLLGFAYIVWVLASKESGAAKTVGQVIAIIIAVLAVLILLYGGIYGGMMGRGWCGRGYYRMGPGMMRQWDDKDQYENMQKFMDKYMKEESK